MDILVKGGIILPMNREESCATFVGSIGIEGNRIVMASADKALEDRFLAAHKGCKIIDAKGKVVMPGLINTHTHVSMALLRGISDDVPLMEWLNEHIWPIEGKMGYKEVYDGARLGMLEMLLGGTTTMVDMYPYDEAVAEAAECAGMRAVVCPCAMDFRMPLYEQDMTNIQARFKDSSLVSMMVAQHAIYTLTKENLKHSISQADELGLMRHVHLSETQVEVDGAMQAYGKSPVEYFEEMGLFAKPVLAAHCVVMSDHDIEILAAHGASVAHNPQSNMKLASGIAPVKKMLDAGVNVALGTDGASSNNDLDMWEEMRTASLLQKVATMDTCAIPAYTALKMATVNGAKAIGREGELGEIREGAIADIILVDIEKAHMYPHTNLVSELVYSSNASDVDTVIVNGAVVVEGRKCLTMDENEVCRIAQEDIDRLMA